MTLDGDSDGLPGGNFTLAFTLTATGTIVVVATVPAVAAAGKRLSIPGPGAPPAERQ